VERAGSVPRDNVFVVRRRFTRPSAASTCHTRAPRSRRLRRSVPPSCWSERERVVSYCDEKNGLIRAHAAALNGYIEMVSKRHDG
jgi:hypothetical protein